MDFTESVIEQERALRAHMMEHHFGAQNAAKNAVIARQLYFPDCGSGGREGYRSSRRLTELFNFGRAQGVPYVYNQEGCFLARAYDETEYFRRQETARAQTLLAQVGLLDHCEYTAT